MQLADKKGIRCDFCSGVHKEQFEYYSMDATRITVLGIMSNKFQHDFNKDMCKSCYDTLIERVKKNIGNVRRLHIKCDLCIKYHVGQFTYYQVILALVNVDITREKPVEAQHRIMDFNIGTCCMKELEAQVAKTVDNIKREGNWS